MTNPVGELVLLGNPRGSTVAKKSRRSRTGKKKGRSAAQRAATARMLAANRAARSGKRKATKVRRKRRTARRSAAAASSAPRTGGRRKRHTHWGPVSAHERRVNPKRRRKHARRRNPAVSATATTRVMTSTPGRRRTFGVAGLSAKLKRLPAVLSDTVWPKATVDKLKSGGGIVVGGVGTLFGGTLVGRVTLPLALRFAPKVATSKLGSRLVALLTYASSAWIVSRAFPGLSVRTRRAMLVGGAAVSLVEAAKPGLVAKGISHLPIIGKPLTDGLVNLEASLSDYVADSLGVAMNGYEQLADYDQLGDAEDNEASRLIPHDPTDPIDDRRETMAAAEGMSGAQGDDTPASAMGANSLGMGGEDGDQLADYDQLGDTIGGEDDGGGMGCANVPTGAEDLLHVQSADL